MSLFNYDLNKFYQYYNYNGCYKVTIMIKNIIEIGNSWGVIIPQTILKLLKINPVQDKLEFSVENDVLKIKKAPKKEE